MDDYLFDLCKEGEKIIKTYECTAIKRWFWGKSIGRLTVTNKRVVYHAVGKSIRGKSLLLSEMSIDDVSGISSYIGSSINWLFLLLFAVILYVVAPLILEISPRFLTSLVFGLVLVVPYALFWLWSKNIMSQEMKANISEKLKGISDNETIRKIPSGWGVKLCYWLFLYGLFVFCSRIFTGDFTFLRFLLYGLLFFLIFGLHRVFTLVLFSKTAKGAGIYLPGVQQFSLFRDTSASDTLSGAPALDAEKVQQEIGALITDLKQMGDLSIAKWM